MILCSDWLLILVLLLVSLTCKTVFFLKIKIPSGSLKKTISWNSLSYNRCVLGGGGGGGQHIPAGLPNPPP